jgi:hypothetical protein
MSVTQPASRSQFTLTRKKRCYLTSSPTPIDVDEIEEDLLCPFGSEDFLQKILQSEDLQNGEGEKSSASDANE